MTDPVQLKYQTKDGGERIVLLPTIDINAPDMLALLAGVIIHQHDQIVKMNRRIEALEADVYAAPEAEAQVPGTENVMVGYTPSTVVTDEPDVEDPAEYTPEAWPESEFRKKN